MVLFCAKNSKMLLYLVSGSADFRFPEKAGGPLFRLPAFLFPEKNTIIRRYKVE